MQKPRIDDAAQVQGLFVLFGLPIAAFFPFLALYLERHHGLDAAQIGLLIAISAVARMIANPLWGHYADTKLGRLLVLQICLIGSGIAAMLLNIQWGIYAAVVAAAVVHSFFLVGQGSNIDAIALVHLGQDRMSDYGRIRGWESMSYAVGCLCFGAILQAFGMQWTMPIYTVAVLLVFLWTLQIERDRPTALEDHGRLGAVGAVFREAPRFWFFLLAVFLVWTGFNAAWNFISLRIADQGGGAFLVGLGTALGGVLEIFTMRASSGLQKRWGLRRVYIAGCCVYAAGFLAWGAVSNPTALSIMTMFEGVGFSLLFTTSVVVVGRLVPQHLYSTGNAITATVGFGIGPILGAGVGGLVYQHLGPGVLYASASALALSAGVVAWFALRGPELDRPALGEEEEPPVAPFPDTGPTV